MIFQCGWISGLIQEKIEAASSLVQEQLEAGLLVESQSPWNTPIFIIKKKSGKWRLLQDLRKVNETMVPMGPLQPGLPSPVAIPKGYYEIVVDLKDCFFTIPLHPKDCERFAFSVPSINFKEPMKRSQWTVLPQGMANSPTLCQKFVAQAIQPVRRQWPMIYIIHFTDDVLMAGKDLQDLLLCYRDSLASEGLLVLQQVGKAIEEQFVTYIDYSLPLHLLIFNTIHVPTGLLWQKSPLMWIHLRISPKRNILPYYEAVAQMIIIGRKQALTYFGKEPDIIVPPYIISQDTWLNSILQIGCLLK
jgi:hypothetical protein